MPDFSVYETVQAIKEFVYSRTDVPSVASLNECLEVYRALIDQFSEDLENVVQGIEAGLDRPANAPVDEVLLVEEDAPAPDEATEPVPVETPAPVDETPVVDAPVDEPAPEAPVAVDESAGDDAHLVDPLNPPIDDAQAPVTTIDDAQPITDDMPVAANEPVTDEDVATALENAPVSNPVADNGGQSVDDTDPGAAPAPTVVVPQEQGDTEPGPTDVAPDAAPVDAEPVAAPVTEDTDSTVSEEATPAEPTNQ